MCSCKQRTFPKVPRFKAALQELERLYRRIMQADPAVQVLVDFGLVNQAEYYTGVVFRGYLPGVGQPVLSGGRYDRLLNDFGLQKPAIGFAIQLDAVAGYLQQTQPQRPTPPAALVYWTQEQSARGFAFLKQLRKQGLFCESSLAESREEAEAYARARGIRRLYVVEEQITEVLIGGSRYDDKAAADRPDQRTAGKRYGNTTRTGWAGLPKPSSQKGAG